MSATFQEWRKQVLDFRTGLPYEADGGQIYVLNPGSPTAPTLYSDDKGTVFTNPLIQSGAACSFFTAKSIQSLDIVVLTSDGHARFMKAQTPSDQHITIDPESVGEMLVVPFGPANAGAETDTGLVLAAGLAFTPLGVGLKVVTADAGKTIVAGILSTQPNGAANGFVTTTSLSALGYINLNGKTGQFLGASVAGSVLAYVTDGVAKNISYSVSAGVLAAGYFIFHYRIWP